MTKWVDKGVTELGDERVGLDIYIVSTNYYQDEYVRRSCQVRTIATVFRQ